MNIAFLAHDKKKELMVQFCTAYKSVLAKHSLYATATTGRLIADNTGLPITLLLSHVLPISLVRGIPAKFPPKNGGLHSIIAY